MKNRNIPFEKKPIYKKGQTIRVIHSNHIIEILEVRDNRDMSNAFRPDGRDGLEYGLIDHKGDFVYYNWWDLEIPTNQELYFNKRTYVCNLENLVNSAKQTFKKIETDLFIELTNIVKGYHVSDKNDFIFRVIDVGIERPDGFSDGHMFFVKAIPLNKSTLQVSAKIPKGNEAAYAKQIYLYQIKKVLDDKTDITDKVNLKPILEDGKKD